MVGAQHHLPHCRGGPLHVERFGRFDFQCDAVVGILGGAETVVQEELPILQGAITQSELTPRGHRGHSGDDELSARVVKDRRRASSAQAMVEEVHNRSKTWNSPRTRHPNAPKTAHVLQVQPLRAFDSRRFAFMGPDFDLHSYGAAVEEALRPEQIVKSDWSVEAMLNVGWQLLERYSKFGRKLPELGMLVSDHHFDSVAPQGHHRLDWPSE
mmetsp:Transcript_50058/g.140363  ORF Transcript_50058/g.140363 Transcript_50058/m.140363 type:complete len:212 (+) Transcript_50058:604-1239(+)